MGNINIYGVLHNDTPEGIIAKAVQIKDDRLNKLQEDINKEVNERLDFIEDNTEGAKEKFQTINETLQTIDERLTVEETNTTTVNETLQSVDERLNIVEEKTSYISHEENPEFIEVTLDAEGKVLEGIKTDGQKYLAKPSNQDEKLQYQIESLNNEINQNINDSKQIIDESIQSINDSIQAIDERLTTEEEKSSNFTENINEINDTISGIDNLKHVIRGKISILGDSISTFNQEGYKIDDYWMYYPSEGNDVQDVNDTWWMQVLNSIEGASLEINASYSGSKVTGDDFPAMNTRTNVLGNPDTILVALGTNDSGNNVEIGESYNFESENLNNNLFIDAYINGIKSLINNYPDSVIVCITAVGIKDSYAKCIKTIANYFGLTYIDVRKNIDVVAGHPNLDGMTTMANKILTSVYTLNGNIYNLQNWKKDTGLNLIDNPEYLEVTLDAEGKVLEGIKADGTKYFGNKIQQGNVLNSEVVDNPEYLEVTLDAEGKVLEGITVDGQKYLGKPSNQDELIRQEINENINTKLEEANVKIEQLEEDINKNVLTIGLDTLTGELIATCGADNAAFKTGKIDEKTGQIILEFEY